MDNSKYKFFDQSINKLSNMDQIKCEEEITESECINAIKSMKNKKKVKTLMELQWNFINFF